MRRWNGWGDDHNDFPLKTAGLSFLTKELGRGRMLPDASLEEALAQIPASRLRDIPAGLPVSTEAEDRLRHARGQSLPDWLAMREGNPGRVPDGVAFPENAKHVRSLLQWAAGQSLVVIPYGGGTSVAGHINTPASEHPVVVVSLAHMNTLVALDETSLLATLGAGANGPKVETLLNQKGYTLGHFPQSWELSTIGGWVASRSSGQQSMRYGRIEQLFAGARMETLKGTLELPTHPASSAGPDVREMVLGSEGRMGIITEVDARVSPLPEHESFHVAFTRNWKEGEALVRALVQSRLPLSMLRLSNAEETRTQLILAGHERQVAWLNRYLGWRGAKDEKCMITFGITGDAHFCRHLLKTTRKRLRQADAIYLGTLLGKKWEEARFRSPYLRHGLWSNGYVVDTLETSVDWSKVEETLQVVENAIRQSAPAGEKVHVFTHLSHLYNEGSSIYTTYVWRNGETYASTLAAWKAMKSAASDAIVAQGGTISHQHGVGRDHAPWLVHEKGKLGLAAIETLTRFFDPEEHLNPGCLLPQQEYKKEI
jgi:alkyldihydroxyacetonephosphate synthase